MMLKRYPGVLLAAVILLAVGGCGTTYTYTNPPPSFDSSRLVGTWQATYAGRALDTLILRADGVFMQRYRPGSGGGDSFETSWSGWSLERFPDGRIRLHLEGARYFPGGSSMAELRGLDSPCADPLPQCLKGHHPWLFRDPIGNESVVMVGELVLNVQVESPEQLVLLPMLDNVDAGWRLALSGKALDAFYRVAGP